MNTLLELKNVHKSYRMGDETVHVLRDISLNITSGDYVAIMGPSGSGKSTLMHILGLLDVPDSGEHICLGKKVIELSSDELAELRSNSIGFVFQQFNLLPGRDAIGNIRLPSQYSTKQVHQGRVRELIEQVGLAHRGEHRPNQLSGGQQQRVAIARALMNRPQLILADEPTGNLDSVSEEQILTIIGHLNDAGTTVVLVTHEEAVAKRAKRIIRMRDGRIESDERHTPLPRGQAIPAPLQESRRAPLMMAVHQNLRDAVDALIEKPIRTWLSMLGVTIGVAAIIVVLALGEGAQDAINRQFSSIGLSRLTISPKTHPARDSARPTQLSLEDYELIEKHVEGIRATSAIIALPGEQVAHRNRNFVTTVLGVSASNPDVDENTPTVGRFFTSEENHRHARVAVVGANLARYLFGDVSPIGEEIKIRKVNFEVIGVLPERGEALGSNQDQLVQVPLFTAMRRLSSRTDIDVINVKTESPENNEAIRIRITSLLNSNRRNIRSMGRAGIEITDMTAVRNAYAKSSETLTTLLSCIAAISLLVGGIGLMNVMLVSVTERTREIGLRKALGARQRDILLQFLTEAGAISLTGSLLGVAIAGSGTIILSHSVGWSAPITMTSVIVSIVLAIIAGLAFGIYPAVSAAKLNPIEALRSE